MGNQYSSECRQDLSDRSMSLVSSNSCSDLPNDVMREIICRLPEKPLIRFKCVSKAWNFFISNVCVPKISPSMPLSGFLFHKTFPIGFGLESNRFMDYAPYPPSPSPSPSPSLSLSPPQNRVRWCSALLHFDQTLYDLEDCCNGLLLFVRRTSVPAEYYVCNPVTKQRVAIPTNPTHLLPMLAALAFNPTETLNYKMVAFSASISNPPKLDIFSSDTGKWVSHAVPLDPAVYGFKWMKRGVYLNGGVLYMLCCARYLVSFDIKTAGNVLPEKDRFVYRGCFGVSKGCFYYSNQDGYELCIWSLDGGECKWNLRHKISFKRFVAAPPLGNLVYERRLHPSTRPCAFHPTCEMIILGTPKMIFSYHLKTKRLELLIDMKDVKNVLLGNPHTIFTYSRCLVVLNDFSIRK